MDVIIGAVRAFTENCVVGVIANTEQAEGWLARNAILVTALNPVIGYLKGVEVAKEAADRAKKAGKPHIERLAGRQLNIYVSGGCGGSVSGLVDPEVLRRVADDLYVAARYAEAIRAYRTVIAATPSTAEEQGFSHWLTILDGYMLINILDQLK